MRAAFVLVALALLTSCAGPPAAVPQGALLGDDAGGDAASRGGPPAPLGRHVFTPPVPASYTLPNGARVLTLLRPGPLCAVEVLFPGQATQLKPGALSLVAFELQAGSTKRGGFEMLRAFDEAKASFDHFLGVDGVHARVIFPPEEMSAALDMLAEATQPAFPGQSFDLQKAYRADVLDRPINFTREINSEELRFALLGRSHPQAARRHGTAADARAVTRGDAVAAWARVAVPSRMVVAVGGACEETALKTDLERTFGGFTGTPSPAFETPALPLPSPRKILFVDRPGLPQVELRWGIIGAPDADIPKRDVVVVVRDLVRRRLKRRLDEALGVTSDIDVDIVNPPGGSWIEVSVRTSTANAARSLEEIARAYDGIGEVADAELGMAVEHVTLSYPASFERAEDLTSLLLHVSTTGLPLEQIGRFEAGIRGVTSARVRAFAKTNLSRDKGVISIAGDFAAARAGLEALGWGTIERR